jgi:hypothetical protein
MARDGVMTAADFQEALWDAAQQHGVDLDPLHQVAIARRLAGIGLGRVTATAVRDAFVAKGLSRPTVVYAKAVIDRVRLLADNGGSP